MNYWLNESSSRVLIIAGCLKPIALLSLVMTLIIKKKSNVEWASEGMRRKW